jgi:hypothetical protein
MVGELLRDQEWLSVIIEVGAVCACACVLDGESVAGCKERVRVCECCRARESLHKLLKLRESLCESVVHVINTYTCKNFTREDFVF